MKPRQTPLPGAVLQKLKTSPLLVLLDYDGTLTDFKNDPELSRINPSVRSLLYRLKRLHPVLMITGRYADSLEKVSGLKGIPIVGTHGFEARRLPGKIQFASQALRRRYKKEAASLWKAAKGLPSRFPGIHVEKKPFSSTLHFRGVNLSQIKIRELIKEYKNHFKQSVTRKIWELKDGNQMVEAMPKGFSKGKAVRKILKKFPGRFPLYAGDDLGDISVLKVLRKKGLRIAVGHRIPGRYCDLRFENPKAFIQWLKKLAQKTL